MGFAAQVLAHSPSFLLFFDKNGVVTNLAGGSVRHEFIGSATPITVTAPITPSAGDFGGGLKLVSTSANTVAASSAYRVRYEGVNSNAALRPKNKITIILVCNKPDFRRYGGFMSCTQSGGWNIEYSSTNQTLSAVVRAGTGYTRAEVPAGFELEAKSNLLIATYDGRYVKLYNNGVLVSTADSGGANLIEYNATRTVHITIGAEADYDEGYSDFLGLGVEYAGMIPDVALTELQIQALYAGFSASYKMSGKLTQSDGSAGKSVRVRSWYNDSLTQAETRGKTLDITPSAIDGAWEVSVPNGNYEVVMTGSTGYAPIVHGPISPKPI